MDAGHYISRSNMSTIYNELNVWAQCRSCNRFKHGNIPEYAVFLKSKFGHDILDQLTYLSHQTKKWTQFEIDNMRDYYKQKAKELANEKGLIL